MKNIKESIEISELGESEKKLMGRLEETTDVLWANRAEVDFVYEKIKEFLPTRTVEHSTPDGNVINWEVPLNWEEIKKLQDDGLLLKEMEKVSRNKLAENFSGNILEAKVRNVRRKIYSLVSKGLLKYKEVMEKDNLDERMRKYSQAKTDEGKEEIWEQVSPEMKIISNFRRFRLKELARGKKALESKNNEIENVLFDLNVARNDGDIEAIDEINEEQKKLIDEYKKILYSSPEAYYWRRMLDLKEIKDSLDEGGKIVETPYVKETMAMIDSLATSGRPVFIHGELGSGKTELAKYICRKTYSQKYLQRWEEENPKPKYPGEIDDWNVRREKEKNPLIISGHKNMDIGEALGSRGMELSESPAPEEQVRIIEEALKKFEFEESSRGEEATQDQKESLRKAYQEGFKNFVEVKEVLGLFYQAMRDGRPIILDEMNAIPHSILIALNDLLQSRAGDRVIPIIPGAKPFEVQEGFLVLATGNWKPEDGKAYIGRQPIDAAFLSRFGIVSYDYLPQRIKGETLETSDENKRKEKSESELFMLMVVHILDKDTLGANIPKGTFEKLRGLAQAARVLQDVFSEKSEINFHDPDSGVDIPAKDILGENVLSIRHLIPILENWKKDGFSRDLDDYVMLNFVGRSSGARPLEKKFVYQIIQSISDKQIFSTENSKWPDSFSNEGLREIDNYPIKSKMFGYDREVGHIKPVEEKIEKVFYSPQQVIEEVFGPAPKRKTVDKKLFYKSRDADSLDESGADIEAERNRLAIFNDLEKMANNILGGGYEISKEERKTLIELGKITQKI